LVLPFGIFDLGFVRKVSGFSSDLKPARLPSGLKECRVFHGILMAKPDQEIIRRVLAGEKKAFADLVNRHKDKAMTLAVRMLKNREDAEEALQDAFVRAFHALPRFEWKASFSTWFYRIVFNVCATALSKKDEAYEVSLQDGDEGGIEVPSDDLTPDVEYESTELQKIVTEEIEKMPHVYASVLTLFFVQEMSYEEIEAVTGFPLGTVKVRLFRARMMLRETIARRLGWRKEVVA
jgi:RNA polymerase sigma-70 factor (ECF subfamily)